MQKAIKELKKQNESNQEKRNSLILLLIFSLTQNYFRKELFIYIVYITQYQIKNKITEIFQSNQIQPAKKNIVNNYQMLS